MDLMAQGLTDPTFLFLALLAVTIAFLLLRVQRHFGRTSSPRPSLAPLGKREPAPRAHHPQAPSAIANWEVEMHDIARELSAQLNTKMGLLEHLIREADRAAARLEAALAAVRTGGATAQGAASAASPLPSSGTEPADARPVSQAEALKSASQADRAALAGGEDLPGRRPPLERRYEEVYTLADYGYDAAEIARRLGTPVGEVQLILGLRPKG